MGIVQVLDDKDILAAWDFIKPQNNYNYLFPPLPPFPFQEPWIQIHYGRLAALPETNTIQQDKHWYKAVCNRRFYIVFLSQTFNNSAHIPRVSSNSPGVSKTRNLYKEMNNYLIT